MAISMSCWSSEPIRKTVIYRFYRRTEGLTCTQKETCTDGWQKERNRVRKDIGYQQYVGWPENTSRRYTLMKELSQWEDRGTCTHMFWFDIGGSVLIVQHCNGLDHRSQQTWNQGPICGPVPKVWEQWSWDALIMSGLCISTQRMNTESLFQTLCPGSALCALVNREACVNVS